MKLNPNIGLDSESEYDGDGATDLSSKDGNGTWYIDLADGGFGGWDLIVPGYGNEWFAPVPAADYDGDRKDDIAVKDGNGTWHIDLAEDGFDSHWDREHPSYGPVSWVPLYMRYGDVPVVNAILGGIKPAVVAIVLAAAWRIGSRSLRHPLLWAIAAAAFVALFTFGVPFPLVILGAALAGIAGGRFAPQAFASAGHAGRHVHLQSRQTTQRDRPCAGRDGIAFRQRDCRWKSTHAHECILWQRVYRRDLEGERSLRGRSCADGGGSRDAWLLGAGRLRQAQGRRLIGAESRADGPKQG